MTDNNENTPTEKLDRAAFFKDIRERLLESMGMPKDTTPENFIKAMLTMEIKEQLDEIKRKKND
jgi:hypothetical protein